LTNYRIRQRVGSPLYQAARSLADAIRSEPSSAVQIDRFCDDRSLRYRDFLIAFKRLSGTTPVRFLQSHRIDQAKRLLARPDITIANICYELGYESVSTFTRTFTGLVGLTPSSFRCLISQVKNWEMGWFLNELQRVMPRTGLIREIPGFLSTTHARGEITFIGLFGSAIPGNELIAGAVIVGQGRFNLNVGVQAKSLFVLAASFEADATPLDTLFPDSGRIRVASIALSPQNIKTLAPIALHLRPMSCLDPPIVYALPSLLSKRHSGSKLRP
jgi:AraC family transcriptional regulator